MESKIVYCDCGEFIGVITDNGLLVGNINVTKLQCFCSNCEAFIDYNWIDQEVIIESKDIKD